MESEPGSILERGCKKEKYSQSVRFLWGIYKFSRKVRVVMKTKMSKTDCNPARDMTEAAVSWFNFTSCLATIFRKERTNLSDREPCLKVFLTVFLFSDGDNDAAAAGTISGHVRTTGVQKYPSAEEQKQELFFSFSSHLRAATNQWRVICKKTAARGRSYCKHTTARLWEEVFSILISDLYVSAALWSKW